jgi:hypothetical protein
MNERLREKCQEAVLRIPYPRCIAAIERLKP